MKSDSKVFKSTETRLKEIQDELEQGREWSWAQGLFLSGQPLLVIGLAMTIDTVFKLFTEPTELLSSSLAPYVVMMIVGSWLTIQGIRAKPKKSSLS